MADTTSLLPPSTTGAERAIELTTARLAEVSVRVRESWDPTTCPARLLPWLAWAFSVDEWNASWTEAQQRQVIQDSLYVHKHKGTVTAIERACAALGFSISLTEWFQDTPVGPPYTFRVEVPLPKMPNAIDIFDQLTRLMIAYKNARSQLVGLTMTADIEGTAWVICAILSGTTVEVLPLIPEVLHSAGNVYLAVTHQAGNLTIVYPLETLVYDTNFLCDSDANWSR